MRRSHLAVLTKLWALLCVTVGVSLTSNAVLTCTLTLLGFTYLGFQRNWRLLRSFGEEKNGIRLRVQGSQAWAYECGRKTPRAHRGAW